MHCTRPIEQPSSDLHAPSRVLLWGGQQQSAVRNGQVLVRICMRNKPRQTLTRVGRNLSSSSIARGMFRRGNPMFFARRPDGLDSHGLIETLSLCCYARAAEAHAIGNRILISRPVGRRFAALIVPWCNRIASEAIARPRPFPSVPCASPLIR